MSWIDKSWMRISNRLSEEYREGVRKFLDFAFDRIAPPDGKIVCPCRDCGRVIRKDRGNCEADLVIRGIDLTYTRWFSHGEEIDEVSMVAHDENANTVADDDDTEIFQMASQSSTVRTGRSRRATPGFEDAASGSSSSEVPATELPSAGLTTARRGVGERGPTRAEYQTNLRDTRLPLQWQGSCYVGPNHEHATTWIRQIVRDESLAPLVGIKRWKNIDDASREKMYRAFLEKFDWPDRGTHDHRNDLWGIMKHRYKAYRYELHKAYGYLVGVSAEDLQAATAEENAPPLHVLQFFVSHWATPAFQGKSERGKRNRAASTIPAPFMGRRRTRWSE